jgi:hypothetical protein
MSRAGRRRLDWIVSRHYESGTNDRKGIMESRSWYEQEKAMNRIMEESKAPGTLAAGYVGNRQERRAKAAEDKRAAKKQQKVKVT